MSKRLLIPFLGAGVNLANRPPDTTFRPEGPYLPNAAELSESIARECNYPWPDKNLLRVSWYASYAMEGDDRVYGKDLLYQHLHRIFNRPYPVPDVHRFFARLPKKLAEKGYPNRHQLIVTTNYDDMLEQAFQEENEEYDLISYAEHGDSQSKGTVPGFRHTPYKGKPKLLLNHNDFIPTLGRTIILKIHGAIDRENWARSSFVITEDDYIDYLALRIPDQIPATLAEIMLHRRFLFLGYSLSDWNLRVLLRSIKARSSFNQPTWAIMNTHEAWDPMYWKKHGVRLEKCPLQDYMEILNEQLDSFPHNESDD